MGPDYVLNPKLLAGSSHEGVIQEKGGNAMTKGRANDAMLTAQPHMRPDQASSTDNLLLLLKQWYEAGALDP